MIINLIDKLKEMKDIKLINKYIKRDTSNLGKAAAIGEAVSKRFFDRWCGKQITVGEEVCGYLKTDREDDIYYIFKSASGELYLEKNIFINEVNERNEKKFRVEMYDLQI